MPDDVGVAGLHVNHPLNIAHQRRQASIARGMSSSPMFAGFGRPDSSGSLNINQAMPSTADLMRPQATSLSDPFHNQASQSGIEAMGAGGGFGRIGGGAPGSLQAALSGTAAHKQQLAGMEPLKPFAPSWTPSEQLAGKPRPAGFGQQMAGQAARPQGVAASAPAVGKFAPTATPPAMSPLPTPTSTPADLPANVFAPPPVDPLIAAHMNPTGTIPLPLKDPMAAAASKQPPNVTQWLGTRQERERAQARAAGNQDPAIVGDPRQRAMARQGRPVPGFAAGGGAAAPGVPTTGITAGMGAIGQAIGRLFGGGGQAQPENYGLGNDPHDQIIATGEAMAQRARQAGNPSGALDIQIAAMNKAIDARANWQNAIVAAKQNEGALGVSKQQANTAALTAGANAAQLKADADRIKLVTASHRLMNKLGPDKVEAIKAGTLTGPAANDAVAEANRAIALEDAGGGAPGGGGAPPAAPGNDIRQVLLNKLVPPEGATARGAFDMMRAHRVDPMGPEGSEAFKRLQIALGGPDELARQTEAPYEGGWFGYGGPFGLPKGYSTGIGDAFGRLLKGHNPFDAGAAGAKEQAMRQQLHDWFIRQSNQR